LEFDCDARRVCNDPVRQRANRRDNPALHAKLDELLRVDKAARSELTRLDQHEPEVFERHREEDVREVSP
jgi:low affinity Fe/Cu permease